MDRSKPFRRLFALGFVSVAGLTGCATAPAYRPVVTSPAPPHPVATATPAASGAPVAAGPATGPPISDAPASAAPAPPADSPARVTTPPTPPQSTSDSGVNGAPALDLPSTNGVQPYLNAPMGVLQTPLPTPPAPITVPSETDPPQAAPQVPADGGASGQSAVSVNIDAESGRGVRPDASTQKPADKKRKPAKPADPPLSPLARLRNRFHSLTRPSKPAPKKEDPATTTHSTHLVTGSRVPLPTADVALKVQTPPIHGLYASDDAENARPGAPSVATVPVQAPTQPSGENSQASTAVVAATQPVTKSGIEEWPNAAPAATPRSSGATSEPSDDFTAIPDEEYRATVAKIQGASEPTPKTEWPAQRATTSAPASQNQAQSTPPAPPPAPPAVGSTAPNSPSGEAGAWMVIPKALPKADRLRPPAESSRSEAPSLAASTPAGETLRDLASGSPSTADWSPAVSQGPVIEPASSPNPVSSNQIDPVGNSGASFNPGWTLPPAVYEEPASSPRTYFVPVGSPQADSGRYGKAAWTNSRKSPQPKPALVPAAPVVFRRAPVAPPIIIEPRADAAHGGS
jgi:hypothetical protein